MKSLRDIEKDIYASAADPLHRLAKKAVPGEGPARAKVMLVGEAPGKTEDATGRPFVGRSGKLLDQELERVGLDRKKVFITSVLKFYPPQGKVPKEDVVRSLPWLIAQIEIIKPKIVLLMGNVARQTKAQLPQGPLYRETVHPAAALRFPNYRQVFKKGLKDLARLANLSKKLPKED